MPVILITGTNRGLGLELTRQYLADGWEVHACARRDSAELASLADGAAGLVRHDLDVTDRAAIEALSQRLNELAVDVLLNCAGTMGNVDFAGQGIAPGAFGASSFDDWEQIFRVNVIGPMKMSEAFVEQVARSQQKKIITLSSMVGSIGLNTIGGLYSYRVSKAAVNAMMRSMGLDLKKRGIIALPMHPGWARTDMGGPNADISAAESVTGMRQVIAELGEADAGRFLAFDGSELPW
jgi:NAD(P)-dependent dehydrogenase (short-subunit alcohol dehydrogenase family)